MSSLPKTVISNVSASSSVSNDFAKQEENFNQPFLAISDKNGSSHEVAAAFIINTINAVFVCFVLYLLTNSYIQMSNTPHIEAPHINYTIATLFKLTLAMNGYDKIEK